MKTIEYTPDRCECCGQEKTYVLPIDRGTGKIVRQIALFIGQKGINAVHPRKEMEGSWLTSNDVGNLTRARIHGLIARVRGNPGNYLLTRKGSMFLHGHPVPRFAIVAKKTSVSPSHNVGYFRPDENAITLAETMRSGEMWEGIGYEITEGEVIETKEPTLQMFK